MQNILILQCKEYSKNPKYGVFLKIYFQKRKRMSKLKSKEYYKDLFSKSEWTFETLEAADELCEWVAKED